MKCGDRSVVEYTSSSMRTGKYMCIRYLKVKKLRKKVFDTVNGINKLIQLKLQTKTYA